MAITILRHIFNFLHAKNIHEIVKEISITGTLINAGRLSCPPAVTISNISLVMYNPLDRSWFSPLR
jgi:hypothetical protein